MFLSYSPVPFSSASSRSSINVMSSQISDIDSQVALEELRTGFETRREDLSGCTSDCRKGGLSGREERGELGLEGWVVCSFKSWLYHGAGEKRKEEKRVMARVNGQEREVERKERVEKISSMSRKAISEISTHSLTVLPTAPNAAPRKPQPLPSAPTGSSLKSSNLGKFLEVNPFPTPPLPTPPPPPP